MDLKTSWLPKSSSSSNCSCNVYCASLCADIIRSNSTNYECSESTWADFYSGGLIKRIHSIIPILIPFFICFLTVAIYFAKAIEARGYRGGGKRNRYSGFKVLK